jgi:predicted peroxiredoxin
MEQGGKLLVCTPCVNARHIDESMPVDNAETIAGVRLFGSPSKQTQFSTIKNEDRLRICLIPNSY